MTPAQALSFARQTKRLIPDARIEANPQRVRDVIVEDLAAWYVRASLAASANTPASPQKPSAASQSGSAS